MSASWQSTDGDIKGSRGAPSHLRSSRSRSSNPRPHIEAILSHTGDLSSFKICEYEVQWSDGDVLFHHFPDLKNESIFQDYLTAHRPPSTSRSSDVSHTSVTRSATLVAPAAAHARGLAPPSVSSSRSADSFGREAREFDASALSAREEPLDESEDSDPGSAVPAPRRKDSAVGLLEIHAGAKKLFEVQRKGKHGLADSITGLGKLELSLHELKAHQDSQYDSYSAYLDVAFSEQVMIAWLRALEYGRNILLIGAGCKARVVRRFATLMNKSDVFVADATVSVRDMLCFICRDLLKKDPKDIRSSALSLTYFTMDVLALMNSHYHRDPTTSAVPDIEPTASETVQTGGLLSVDFGAEDRARKSGRRPGAQQAGGRYAHMKSRAYLLLHNIDSPTRAGSESQRCLSLMAACPSLGLLATADHWNTPLLWDTEMLLRFRWWYVVTPGTPFAVDAATLELIAGKKSSTAKLTAEGLAAHVQSLSLAHRDVLSVVCEMSTELSASADTKAPSKKKTASAGAAKLLLLADLFAVCQRRLLCRSQTELERLLREMVDHDVLSFAIDPDQRSCIVLHISDEMAESLILDSS